MAVHYLSGFLTFFIFCGVVLSQISTLVPLLCIIGHSREIKIAALNTVILPASDSLFTT